ncbi:MAG: sulfide-dependent adenosine diphosphate thiazole synthase [Thermodesulfobacteriota bacterium]
MEDRITAAIVDRYFAKLKDHLTIDVAIVGAGPSGLVAARDLAVAGKKVAIFERRLAPGGGIWGGGMLFNEIVVQENVLSILDDFSIGYRDAGNGFYTADAVETASGLIFGARKAGALLLNSVSVEDVVFHENKVCGVVVNWTPVTLAKMHVDPLVIMSRAVVDGTGHPAEVITGACRKAGIRLETETGGIMGEKPMWMEKGEASTVVNTGRLFPGLYASGMAANNAHGGFRMGPIFGGMFLSGRKLAAMIVEDIQAGRA